MRTRIVLRYLCLLALSVFAQFAEANVAVASFEGTIALRALGTRRATLHVRDAGGDSPVHLVGVLAIADSRGEFGNNLVYRFPQVTFDENSKHYHFFLERRSPLGEGTSIFTIDADLSGTTLTGIFQSTQVSPNGELVEGPIRMKRT